MLYYILYGFIGIIVLLFIIIVLLLARKVKFESENREAYIEEQKEKWNAACKEEENRYDAAVRARQQIEWDNTRRQNELTNNIKQRSEDAERTIKALEGQRAAYEKSQKDFEEQQRELTDTKLEVHFQSEKQAYSEQLKKIVEELREAAHGEYETTASQLENELSELYAEVKEYREKRDAINAEILRQRAIDEQQDFYRVVLDQSSIDDINVLNSIRKNLHKHDSLDKLIYDTYVAKPVQEMVKRVLEGEAPSGIYKITRLKTGEIYIGKSTDVKTRWIQHTKTAFGCGTIAHSILHTTMARDGIDQFTFELLEEVPKDKLTERERYYIEFYDSKRYGLNERNG